MASDSLNPLHIGLAGLGTVGCGTVEILQKHAGMLAERCGRPIKLAAIATRNPSKPRPVDVSSLRLVENADVLADDPSLDIIVEVIGGSEGTAKTLVEKALSRGKHVVTANKALIAHHGLALAALAEKNNVVLAFEAAVAGGIPVIKALRDGLAANRFTQIAGIINGTCNYILTRMQREGLDLAPVMEEAGRLGYLEADPSFDIDGIDAAHKLAILTSLAFGCAPAMDKVYTEGIRNITKRDIAFAEKLGYRIKLLGLASLSENGILQRVHPTLIPIGSPLANVNDSFNAVVVEGDSVGRVFLEGRGAGAGPTASSVVADIMDIARGTFYKPFTLPVEKLGAFTSAGMENLRTSYYLRLAVIDRPGVLAEITSLFRHEGISVRSFLQHEQAPNEPVQIVITTHETCESAMMNAVRAIAQTSTIRENPYVIRIENL